MRHSNILIVVKKELYEAVISLRYPIVLGIMLILSVLTGVGGGHFIQFMKHNIPIESTVSLGLTSSRGLSFLILSVFYSPLFVIFLSSDLISKERETRTLIKILSKPITRTQFYLGKIVSLIIMTILMGILSFFAALFSLLTITSLTFSGEEITRLFLFIFVYLEYLVLWGGVGIFSSTIFNRTKISILISIIVYVIFGPLWINIVLPLATFFTNNPLELQLIEYKLKMLSISYVFMEFSSFLLNPHYIDISNGEWIYDWVQKIDIYGSLFLVQGDVILLTFVTLIFYCLSYIIVKKMKITPQG